MAQKRLSMKKNMEILRLRYELGKSEREIRTILSLKSKTTVHRCLQRAESAGISWPLPEGTTEDSLEQMLFPVQPAVNSDKASLDFPYIYERLQHKDATKMYVWEMYSEANPENHYKYTQFCELYNRWAGRLNYSMRQTYKAGEKVFVDFGGEMSVFNKDTGEFQKTHIFVAVLGASKYTYVEAVFSQDLPSWIKVNRHMLEYFGCVPEIIVPDNLKAAVEKACKYEPVVNRTYLEFASHYSAYVAPTRPYEPKDKALAENGVKLVKRWILIRLRDRVFFSLEELNTAIRELLEKFNAKLMKKIGKSRKELFESLDKPAMNPLPEIPFEYAEWKIVKPGPDYHVSFEKHLYSVPCILKGRQLEIRATDTLIELYLKGRHVCSHKRSRKEHGCTTLIEHMPENHKAVAGVTPESLIRQAERIGEHAVKLVKLKLEAGRFPENAYRSCLGILRLERKSGRERLNKACKRAIYFGSMSYQNVSNILQYNLEDQEYEKIPVSRPPLNHENIRGKEEYRERLRDN